MTKKEGELTDIYNQGHITKIFENHRITLNKDLLFLKEDILKEFKLIETNLNSKYEKQKTNITNKLYKFESLIEVMKKKIEDLSSLIYTDKNIQQKILQLFEFKRVTGDRLLNQEITLKLNSSELKDAVNKYDKILSESVIYPGIIGNNGRFKNFHEMIDHILLGINQFNLLKDKNDSVDFKDYAIKIDKLYKSLKSQTDSIVASCNDYCSKKTGEMLTQFEKMVFAQDEKIIKFKKNNDKIRRDMEDKFTEINNIIEYLNKTKEDIYHNFEEKIKKLNEYKEGIEKEFDKFKYEFILINQRLKLINNNIKNEDNKNTKNEENKNKEIIVQNKEYIPESEQNIEIKSKKSQIGSNIVKKYIYGEMSYNEKEHSHSRKQINQITNGRLKEKRMTLGPDNFQNIIKIKSDLNYINSEKNSKDNSQKVDEEFFSNSSYDNNKDKDKDKNNEIYSRNKIQNTIRLKKPSLLNNDEEKSNEVFSTKQKAYQLLMPQNKNDKLSNMNNFRDFNNMDKNKIIKNIRSIGDNNDIVNFKTKKNKKINNNASVDFYETINNKKYNYYSIFNDYKNIQIKNTKNKPNVIEVNFDKKFEVVKEKDNLKDLIKKIKENRNYTTDRKNNNKRKNKVMKLTRSNSGIDNNNIGSLYKNKMIKEEIKNKGNK